MTKETRYAYRASDFGESLPDDPWAVAQTQTQITVTLKRSARPVELVLSGDSLAAPVVLDGQVFPAGGMLQHLWSLVDEGKGTRVTAVRLGAPDRAEGACTLLTTGLPLTPGQNYHLSLPQPEGTGGMVEAGGLASGTRVLTETGKRKVEDIAPGERIWTETGGFRPVLWHGRQTLPARGTVAPVRLGRGLLGLTRDLCVAPAQALRVEVDRRAVLVPAAAFADAGRATREFGASVTWHQILLPEHALIYAEGLAVASLFAADALGTGPPEDWPAGLAPETQTVLPRLSLKEALGAIA